MAEVESSLLEMPVRFQYLTQLKKKVRPVHFNIKIVLNLEMLLPSILIWRLDFKRSSC